MSIMVLCVECGRETRFLWRQEIPLCTECEHLERAREKELARIYVIQEEP